MSSTVTVSSSAATVAIKTDNAQRQQYQTASNPATTTTTLVICHDRDNGARSGTAEEGDLPPLDAEEQQSSAVVNGVTLLDQSITMRMEPINLHGGQRIRINASAEIPSAPEIMLLASPTVNDCDKEEVLSVTNNIDAIRGIASAGEADCEPIECAKKGGHSSDTEPQLGGPRPNVVPVSIVVPSTSASASQSPPGLVVDQNNNSGSAPNRQALLSSDCKLNGNVKEEVELRDCVPGTDTDGNNNHQQHVSREETIEPRSVINGLLDKTSEIPREIIAESSNHSCDKESTSSASVVEVVIEEEEVQPKIESEIAEITNSNQFAQLERQRIILGGSGEVVAQKNTEINSPTNNNLSGGVIDQRVAVVDLLLVDESSDTNPITICKTKKSDKNLEDQKNQVRMDPITDSVIVAKVEGGAMEVPIVVDSSTGQEVEVEEKEVIVVEEEEGHFSDVTVDLTEVDQSSVNGGVQIAAPSAEEVEEKAPEAVAEEVMGPAEEKEMPQEKEGK